MVFVFIVSAGVETLIYQQKKIDNKITKKGSGTSTKERLNSALGFFGSVCLTLLILAFVSILMTAILLSVRL